MRSSIHSTFATLLLLIPVAAIPALAIFGIPQFAPVVSSPLHEGHDQDRERRVGNSARPPADDLFSDVDDFPPHSDDAPLASARMGDSVPIPNRSSARASSTREPMTGTQASRLPGRLPSWADDQENGGLDEAPPPNKPFVSDRVGGKYPIIPASYEGQVERPMQRLPDQEPADERQLADAGGFDAMASMGYQRQRDRSVERHVAPQREPALPRQEAPRESLTWQGAVRRLNELEIRSIRLTPGRDPGQFVFICSYTPPDSPRVSYRFEAEADEPLKAVEKVLEQIDEWQQRQ